MFKLVKDLNPSVTKVKNMVSDKNGDIYFSIVENIFKIKMETKEVVALKFIDGKAENKIKIAQDHQGNIYTITNNRIFKLNFDNDTFETIHFYKKEKISDIKFTKDHIYIKTGKATQDPNRVAQEFVYKSELN